MRYRSAAPQPLRSFFRHPGTRAIASGVLAPSGDRRRHLDLAMGKFRARDDPGPNAKQNPSSKLQKRTFKPAKSGST